MAYTFSIYMWINEYPWLLSSQSPPERALLLLLLLICAGCFAYFLGGGWRTRFVIYLFILLILFFTYPIYLFNYLSIGWFHDFIYLCVQSLFLFIYYLSIYWLINFINPINRDMMPVRGHRSDGRFQKGKGKKVLEESPEDRGHTHTAASNKK